jgi:hypothetical protein
MSPVCWIQVVLGTVLIVTKQQKKLYFFWINNVSMDYSWQKIAP